MPDIIIYNASTGNAINECAYSLLRYLTVYNLKPPPDHVVQIHTHQPALLEMYGSFFNRFELKEKMEDVSGPAFLKTMVAGSDSNVLYLGPSAYPIAPLEPMFDSMKRGEVFISKTKNLKSQPSQELYRVIGFNSHQSFDVAGAGGKDPSQYIAHYGDLAEFSRFLQYFFNRYQEESVPNQVKLLQHIDARKISEEKNQYSSLPLYTRMLRKVTGKAFNIRRYTGKV